MGSVIGVVLVPRGRINETTIAKTKKKKQQDNTESLINKCPWNKKTEGECQVRIVNRLTSSQQQTNKKNTELEIRTPETLAETVRQKTK